MTDFGGPRGRRGRRIAISPWIVAAIFATILSLIGAGLLFGARAMQADAQALANDGVAVQATVTDRRIVEERDRQSNGDVRTTTKYYFGLAFQTAEGTQVQIEELVGRDQYDTAQTGDSLALFYLPSRPDFVEFARGDKLSATGFLRWAGLGLLGLGLVAAVATLVLARRPIAIT